MLCNSQGEFYRVLMPFTKMGTSLPNVFNTRDEALHRELKSPIAPMYSLSSAITYEVFVNQVLEILCHQLDQRYVKTDKTADLDNWLQYFAFDVMGTLTFSKRYGFLEHGRDVNGLLDTIWNYMTDAAPWTQIPWFDELWRKNRLMATLKGSTGIAILKVVAQYTNDRQKKLQESKGVEKDTKLSDRDMLSRFFEVAQINKSVPPW